MMDKSPSRGVMRGSIDLYEICDGVEVVEIYECGFGGGAEEIEGEVEVVMLEGEAVREESWGENGGLFDEERWLGGLDDLDSPVAGHCWSAQTGRDRERVEREVRLCGMQYYILFAE